MNREYFAKLQICSQLLEKLNKKDILLEVAHKAGSSNRLYQLESENLYILRTTGGYCAILSEPPAQKTILNGITAETPSPVSLIKNGYVYGLNKRTADPYFRRNGKAVKLHVDLLSLSGDYDRHHTKHTFDNRYNIMQIMSKSDHKTTHWKEKFADEVMRRGRTLYIDQPEEFFELMVELLDPNY